MRSQIIRRLATGAVCLAALSLTGCANRYTTETRIAGRSVVYRSSADNKVTMKVLNQDTATFTVGQSRFTIDQTHVTWGQDQALTLPPDWKRVEFIDRDNHIAIYVNGTPLGQIRPPVNNPPMQ